MNALNRAIKIIAKGNQSLFAKLVTEQVRKVNENSRLTEFRIPELSQQLVNNWVRSDAPCSAHYAQIISDLSDGKIEPSDLRPDVFLPEPKTKRSKKS